MHNKNEAAIDRKKSKEAFNFRAIFPSCRLLLTGILITLGGSFHFGYALSVVNPTVSVFQHFLNQSLTRHYHWTIDDLAFRLLWSTIASLLVLGATLGALLLSKFPKTVSRKKGLLISSIVLVISFLLSGLSQLADSIEMFAVGRFLCGVGFGMATGFQGLYLTEISPIQFRGFMGMLIGVSICNGFLVGNIVGLPQVLGTDELWPVAFYIEVLPTVILLILLPKVKESPTFLMDMGKTEEARNSIVYFHGADAEVDVLLKDIDKELSVSKKQWSIWQIWRSRPIRNAAVIAILLNIAVSCSGIMVFDFFGTLMLNKVGLSDDAAGYANVGWSAVGIPAAIMSAILVERAGRRFLALSGLMSMTVLNLLMMVMLYAEDRTDCTFLGYLFLLFLTLFYIVFSIGVGPLIWFIGPELSPHHARKSVQAVAIAVHYIFSFLSPIIYFPIEQSPFSFVLFIVPLIVAAVYCYWRMPESKNRHIAEIMLDLGASPKQNRQNTIHISSTNTTTITIC